MERWRNEDYAWAAGLFEGEGHISIQNRSGRGNSKQVSLELPSTDQDILDRFCSVMGGKVSSKKTPPNLKPMFRWFLTGATRCEDALEILLPHLGSRRSTRAMDALGVLLFTKRYQDRVV